MIRLLDGPGADLTFNAANAPSFLRVVQVPHAGGEGRPALPRRWDCLDAIDDEPRDGEVVHVYALVLGTYSIGFACGRGNGAGGAFVTGDYRHVPDAPVDLLYDRAQWRAWAALTYEQRCETGRPLPSAIVAELARLPVEDFRRAAAAIGATEHDDCWTLP